ncbi:MAG TPA: hypothetical protein VNE40_01270 [Candidatus Dormibacteraeota bacterium]|nr:hypothetical protein [Candidatus Dormibacteraeota bacterium]
MNILEANRADLAHQNGLSVLVDKDESVRLGYLMADAVYDNLHSYLLGERSNFRATFDSANPVHSLAQERFAKLIETDKHRVDIPLGDVHEALDRWGETADIIRHEETLIMALGSVSLRVKKSSMPDKPGSDELVTYFCLVLPEQQS